MTHRDSSVDDDHNHLFGADARFQFFNRLNFDAYILKSITGVYGRDCEVETCGQNQARKFETRWNDDELTISAGYITIQPNFNPEVGLFVGGI